MLREDSPRCTIRSRATFHQGTPAFQEDLTIPWEGKRLLDAVRSALPKLKPGEPVKLLARVSEGPEQRQRLTSQMSGHVAAGRREDEPGAGAVRVQAGL